MALSSRLLSLTTYAQDHDILGIINSKSEQIDVAITAYHDKDVKKDGTPKEPHTHLLLLLTNHRRPSEVCNWFKKCTDADGDLVNTFGEVVKYDAQGAYDYLTHSTEAAKADGKYQYDDSIIKVLAGSADDWCAATVEKKEEPTAGEVTEQLLQDVIDGKSARYMAKTYGRDFVKNRRSYVEYAQLMHLEETGELLEGIFADVVEMKVKEGATQWLSTGFEAAFDLCMTTFDETLSERFGSTSCIAGDLNKILRKKIHEKKKGIKP